MAVKLKLKTSGYQQKVIVLRKNSENISTSATSWHSNNIHTDYSLSGSRIKLSNGSANKLWLDLLLTLSVGSNSYNNVTSKSG